MRATLIFVTKVERHCELEHNNILVV